MRNKLLITDPTSYSSLLDTLSLLDTQLASLGLDEFLTFNHTYTIVTQTIRNHSRDNYFQHPNYVEQFTLAFAGYYIRIIREIIKNSTSESAAWNKLLQAKSHPHSIQLLMGANAHINHDLPLVMLKFADQKYASELFQDVLRIDTLLLRASKTIVSSYDEPYKYLNFTKRHLHLLYILPIMWMILSWRTSAWRRYKKIKKQGLDKESFQKKSIHVANGLFTVGLLLKF